MPINNTSGLYACNFQKGNLGKYQTMPLIHNSTVSDIPWHFQGNTIERVWMGEYKCQLSVKIVIYNRWYMTHMGFTVKSWKK